MKYDAIFFVEPLNIFIMYMYSVLASLNLPAAIEDTSGTEIPQSLLDKAAHVRESGGIRALEQSMKDLPDLLQRNKELLDEVEYYFIIKTF